MIKKIYFMIFFAFMISCTSPFSGGGVKFSNRAGTYQNDDKSVTVIISDKNKDNLTITASINTQTINETLSVIPSLSSQYVKINSVKYVGYLYTLNFGNNINNMFITIRDNNNSNIVFNNKLSFVK